MPLRQVIAMTTAMYPSIRTKMILLMGKVMLTYISFFGSQRCAAIWTIIFLIAMCFINMYSIIIMINCK